MVMVSVIVTAPSPIPTAKADESVEHRGPVLEVLRELIDDGKSDAIIKLVRKLVADNEALLRKLEQQVSRRKTGEGISSAQLKLLLDEVQQEQDKQEDQDETLKQANTELREAAEPDGNNDSAAGKGERRPPRLRKPPANLRRIDNPIGVPEDERPCPTCGGERTCIGHDVTEVVELVPAEIVVRADRREKLACDDCESELVRAPLGDKLVPGGKFGCRFAAELVVDKYRDGLPLNRQRQRLARLGLPVSNSTLADQITWSTDLLRPLWRALSVAVINAAIMQLDGTGLAVRDVNHPQHMKFGTLWGYIGDQQALYLYTSTGKKTGQLEGEVGPEDFLKLRTGYTVADAANLFDKSFCRRDLIECGCNMHARRYFKKALSVGDNRVAVVLAAFKKLYKIEEQIRGRPPDEILAVRLEKSRSIYDKLVQWCVAHEPHVEPRSKTGAAIRYLINHQAALRRFLDHGLIPMDNGDVERLHIRVALTRKNYLFAGSHAGAQRAAIAYSILGCCALANVDPVAYLADVLPRLARGIRLCDAPDFLPLAWKQARA